MAETEQDRRLDKVLTKIDYHVVSIDGGLLAQKTRINQIESDLQGVNERLDAIQVDVGGLRAGLDFIQAELGDLKGLKSDVAALKVGQDRIIELLTGEQDRAE